MDKTKLKRIGTALAPFLGLILLIALFAILTDGASIQLSNFKLLINQTFTLVLVCTGVFGVMTLGMMDLSCGTVVCICCFMVAKVCQVNIFVGLVTALLTGIGMGAFNGFTTSILKMPSFLATLCLQYIITGLMTQLIASAAVTVPAELYFFDEFWYKLPLVLVLLIGAYFLFRHTKLGHYMRMVGSNETAAIFSGINVRKIKMISYTMAGGLCAVSGFLVAIRSGTAAVTSGTDMMFNSMIALTLGGFPNGGGAKARFSAPIVGSFMFCVLNNGLSILGVSSTTQAFIKGAIFLFMVILMAENVKTAVSSGIKKIFGGKEKASEIN